MMLFLMDDILFYPIQVALSETDNPIACLPLQYFIAPTDLLIGFVSAGSFKLTDKIADQYRGRNRYCNMDMRLRSAYFMYENARRIDDSLFQKPMGEFLQSWIQ
jgi:hypothetical protein